jgi:hypothetical protein
MHVMQEQVLKQQSKLRERLHLPERFGDDFRTKLMTRMQLLMEPPWRSIVIFHQQYEHRTPTLLSSICLSKNRKHNRKGG